MSAQTHTPGPWEVLPGLHNHDEIYVGTDGPGGPVVCAVWPMGEDFSNEGPTRQANARLIAAAPELLASLCWALQFAEDFARDHNDGPTMASCIAQAHAAIAKAEGRT